MKDGQIDWDTAKTDILKVDNVNMTGIDELNVDEVLFTEKENYWKEKNASGSSLEESNLDILLNLEEESKRGK